MGSAAEKFKADRFLPPASKVTDADRTRKAASMPLGGSRHLRPGRNFAFAESIGCAAVKSSVIDIDATGMNWGAGNAKAGLVKRHHQACQKR